MVISYLKAAFKLALQSKMLKCLIIFPRDHEPVLWVKCTSVWKWLFHSQEKHFKSNLSDGTLALTDVDK